MVKNMRYLLLFLFLSCSKPDAGFDLTGDWLRDDATLYSFFDDSRFWDSRSSAQWIWEQKWDEVFFYGTPDRHWDIKWISEDELEVIEVDIFKLTRI